MEVPRSGRSVRCLCCWSVARRCCRKLSFSCTRLSKCSRKVSSSFRSSTWTSWNSVRCFPTFFRKGLRCTRFRYPFTFCSSSSVSTLSNNSRSVSKSNGGATIFIHSCRGCGHTTNRSYGSPSRRVLMWSTRLLTQHLASFR